MNMIISFSGRENGNCDSIARYLAADGEQIIHFRELNAHPCSDCGYECFHGPCKYRGDGVYELYAGMLDCDKVILIVPMYCGNPSSLYFAFHERCQDYFMHNDTWDETVRRLYIIGVYGADAETPDFIPCLEKWFSGTPYRGRVLGIQRHKYGQKLDSNVLEVPEVREMIAAFLA